MTLNAVTLSTSCSDGKNVLLPDFNQPQELSYALDPSNLDRSCFTATINESTKVLPMWEEQSLPKPVLVEEDGLIIVNPGPQPEVKEYTFDLILTNKDNNSNQVSTTLTLVV